VSARVHRTPAGAHLEADGAIRFRLWAPAAERIGLQLDGSDRPLPMEKLPGGWHELLTKEAEPGSRYLYVLPDGMQVPDPASRFQPDDVHGPSEVVDPASYAWSVNWAGRDWHEVVLYELHIGAFTPQGTFRSTIDKLDHLTALGITAIEIMPVADFPGRRNWGYDGVLPYAPDSSYGRPEDFKALVEAAHARGIAVLLDVVYNHFGPDGNYLPLYAPAFFTERHHTPWGAAINYDGAGSEVVREFVIHNALYWLEEFDLDGLRLDAVHAIIDDSPTHLLDELASRARALTDRPIHLLLENEGNDVDRLVGQGGTPGSSYTAQWNDDVHHVLHVAGTRERAGYYADYQGRTDFLARALAEGFAYQGEVMPFRGTPRGQPSGFLPPSAFVAFIQNHDQIGNRAFGERLDRLTPAAVMRALSAIYLLLPQVPMLFMGEEWGAQQPFPFFCDFTGDLAEAIRNGRRQEFARFPEFADPEQRERIPDPLSEATFLSAKLDWEGVDALHLARYSALIAVRLREIEPLLSEISRGGTGIVLGEGAVEVRWPIGLGGTLTLAANLSEMPVDFPPAAGRILWIEGDADPSNGRSLGPWSVRWSLEHDEFGLNRLRFPNS
jgi:malto-oligosyltrehalose trehalohydrolase